MSRAETTSTGSKSEGGKRRELIPVWIFLPSCLPSWQSWIGYFRDQGFDCIDANLDFQHKSGSASSTGDDASAGKGPGEGEEHKILADGEWRRPSG